MTLRKVAASISSYNKDEETNKETFKERLLEKLKQHNGSSDMEKAYNENLRDLEHQYPIRNKTLLIKSVGILLFVISVFFLHSIPEMSKDDQIISNTILCIPRKISSFRYRLDSTFGGPSPPLAIRK